jgi:hypothetical protein
MKNKIIILVLLLLIINVTPVYAYSPESKCERTATTGETIVPTYLTQHINYYTPEYLPIDINVKVFILKMEQDNTYMVYIPSVGEYGYMNKSVILLDKENTP